MSDVENAVLGPISSGQKISKFSQDAPPPAPEELIARLEAEVAELKDQLLRAVAEAENIRRRAAKEKLDASKFAIASLARDLLAVPDTLDRAHRQHSRRCPRPGRRGQPDRGHGADPASASGHF